MRKPAFHLAIAFLLGTAAAHAETYPSHPITLLVPAAAGGGNDTVARVVAEKMGKLLGQQIVIDNRPGAGGSIAGRQVARAEPDGYTIGIGNPATLAIAPAMLPNVGYDPVKDFVPVGMIASSPHIVMVNTAFPAKSLAEFIALAKKEPGKLNYGSAGNGSAGHLAFEYLKLVTGIDVVHVPYKGTGPQLQDLLGGRLDASSAGLPALMPHIKSGKLVAFAVGTPQRIPALPDVPTVAEMGYKDFETSQWYGIIAPKGTPRDVVMKLNTEINKALASSAVTQRFADDNAAAGLGSPEDFAAFIAKEQARWKEVVERGKIRIE
jgi:tripartite-type tricarboxylate transporter receptor subunit TctC